MPNGKVHYKIWKRSWFLAITMAIILLVAASQYWLAAAFIPVGYFMGRYFSPDLDLVGINSDESRMMDDFKIFGAFMVAYWFPYAYLMRFIGIGRKGHRNFFSHFPVVSTIIRFLYLAIPVILAFYYFDLPVRPEYALIVTGVLVGMSIADTLHWAADMLESRAKRNRDRLWKELFS